MCKSIFPKFSLFLFLRFSVGSVLVLIALIAIPTVIFVCIRHKRRKAALAQDSLAQVSQTATPLFTNEEGNKTNKKSSSSTSKKKSDGSVEGKPSKDAKKKKSKHGKSVEESGKTSKQSAVKDPTGASSKKQPSHIIVPSAASRPNNYDNLPIQPLSLKKTQQPSADPSVPLSKINNPASESSVIMPKVKKPSVPRVSRKYFTKSDDKLSQEPVQQAKESVQPAKAKKSQDEDLRSMKATPKLRTADGGKTIATQMTQDTLEEEK